MINNKNLTVFNGDSDIEVLQKIVIRTNTSVIFSCFWFKCVVFLHSLQKHPCVSEQFFLHSPVFLFFCRLNISCLTFLLHSYYIIVYSFCPYLTHRATAFTFLNKDVKTLMRLKLNKIYCNSKLRYKYAINFLLNHLSQFIYKLYVFCL